MKATKYTLKIEAEALSFDCMIDLLTRAATVINDEAHEGHITLDDGDTVKWVTEKKEVEF